MWANDRPDFHTSAVVVTEALNDAAEELGATLNALHSAADAAQTADNHEIAKRINGVATELCSPALSLCQIVMELESGHVGG